MKLKQWATSCFRCSSRKHFVQTDKPTPDPLGVLSSKKLANAPHEKIPAAPDALEETDLVVSAVHARGMQTRSTEHETCVRDTDVEEEPTIENGHDGSFRKAVAVLSAPNMPQGDLLKQASTLFVESRSISWDSTKDVHGSDVENHPNTTLGVVDLTQGRKEEKNEQCDEVDLKKVPTMDLGDVVGKWQGKMKSSTQTASLLEQSSSDGFQHRGFSEIRGADGLDFEPKLVRQKSISCHPILVRALSHLSSAASEISYADEVLQDSDEE